jgi:hypothetical protein
MRAIVFICLFTLANNCILKAQSTTQDYVFKVLASSGSNTIAKNASDGSWKPLKTGQKVTKDDKIMVADNSFIGLVHKSGRTLELKSPGTYIATDLSSKVGTAPASFNQKYVDFVIGEMTKAEKVDANKNRHQNMGIEGKVERGDFAITALIPKSSDVLGSQLLIKWYASSGTRQYKISVTDMFDEVLYSATTSDTTFTLDLNQPALKKESSYLVAINSVEKPKVTSDKYSIRKLDEKSTVALNRNLASIKEGAEESSLNKIIQASLLEENKLYLDALQCYEQAIHMQPQVKDYQLAYHQFLQRNNLVKQ